MMTKYMLDETGLIYDKVSRDHINQAGAVEELNKLQAKNDQLERNVEAEDSLRNQLTYMLQELKSENERLREQIRINARACAEGDNGEVTAQRAFKAVMEKYGITITNKRGLTIFAHLAPCSPIIFDTYDYVTLRAEDIEIDD